MTNNSTKLDVRILSAPELRFAVKVDEAMFGADMLRFKDTRSFQESALELGVSGVRWPGEIVVDPTYGTSTEARSNRWIEEFNPDGSVGRYSYDLKNENIVDTLGFPREGLREALAFAFENELSFTMLIPEDRYISVNTGVAKGESPFSLDLQSVSRDLDIFLERLAAGHFGNVPKDFTLQIGQEYYTGQVQHLTRLYELDHTQRVEAAGQLYNGIAKLIDEKVNKLTSERRNVQDIDPDVIVHIGRLFGDYGFGHSGPYSGSVHDGEILAEQFDREGFQALDGLLIQRYVPTWNGIDDGFLEPIQGYTLRDLEAVWEGAANSVGLADKQFTLEAGWAMSSTIREEIRQAYSGNVTDAEFRIRSNFQFEKYVQDVWRSKEIYGLQHPSSVLQLFSHLVDADIQSATYYGVDLGKAGQLSGRTVDGDIVTFTAGTLFKNLRENLPGKTLNNSYLLNSRREFTDAGKVKINANVFEDENEIVIYAWVNDIPDTGVTTTVDFGPNVVVDWWFDSVEHTYFRSKVLPNWRETFGITNLDQKWGKGFQDAEAALHFVAETDENGSLPQKYFSTIEDGLTLEFTQDFEVIQIVLERNSNFAFAPGIPEASVSLEGTSDNDHMIGSNDDDFIRGRAGADTIRGLDGDDAIFGDTGDDTISTQNGNSVVFGGTGDDEITVGDGKNYISGGKGKDQLYGGSGDDLLFGNNGNDTIYGQNGDDLISGGGSRDIVLGGAGEDILEGNRGQDELFGESGDDVLVGGLGNDLLFGGAGADNFIFKVGDGHDVIGDFDASANDVIDLSSFSFHEDKKKFWSEFVSQDGSSTIIELDHSGSIELENTLLSNVTSDNILL